MKKLLATPLIALTALLLPSIALAAPEEASGPSPDTYALAVAFAMAIATFGGAMGQGRAAAAALDGICRNPSAAEKVFTPMILGLAFIESLVIFTFVSAFIIQ